MAELGLWWNVQSSFLPNVFLLMVMARESEFYRGERKAGIELAKDNLGDCECRFHADNSVEQSGRVSPLANTHLFADESKPQAASSHCLQHLQLHRLATPTPLAQQAVAKGQMAKRLAMELALYEPDIINFSESPTEELTKEVAELLGMNHVRFPSGGNWPGTLLSKFEIIESQDAPVRAERPTELFTRHWGRAMVKLPDGAF